MATKRATMSASAWLAMPIDRLWRTTRQALVVAAVLGLGGAPPVGAAEGETTPSAAGDEAAKDQEAPPPREDGASRGNKRRPAPLIVPSEEVSVDSAVSFPADI